MNKMNKLSSIHEGLLLVKKMMDGNEETKEMGSMSINSVITALRHRWQAISIGMVHHGKIVHFSASTFPTSRGRKCLEMAQARAS